MSVLDKQFMKCVWPLFAFFRPKLVLVIYGNDGENTEVVCRDLSDLEDYYQPYSPGKLIMTLRITILIFYLCNGMVIHVHVHMIPYTLDTVYNEKYKL